MSILAKADWAEAGCQIRDLLPSTYASGVSQSRISVHNGC